MIISIENQSIPQNSYNIIIIIFVMLYSSFVTKTLKKKILEPPLGTIILLFKNLKSDIGSGQRQTVSQSATD